MRAGGWRLAVLTGLGVGLAISPVWAPAGGLIRAAVALVLVLVLLVDRGRVGVIGAILVFVASMLVGIELGGERIRAIDGGALSAGDGERIEISGFVIGSPKTSRGTTRIPVSADSGKVMVESGQVPDGLRVGDQIRVAGTAGRAPDWYRPTLERLGIAMVLKADRISPTGQSRGGVSGWIDGLRNRAEGALGRAMPEREAALARGFVLGQDDAIDDKTTDEFQDSGLSHLLAVSGQNVVLLGLLAIPFMALAGLGPGARIGVVVALIAVYVPLTGAGASIQRAGIMGIAGLAAVAASRPGSRLYALALAVVLTLALNPRAGSDIGWQLSFAAVLGIFLLVGPIQRRLEVLVGSGGWRSGLGGGIAVTLAATIATAPLIAFHFERFPLTTLGANLLALPAVAPAMWLGMLSAALGQISGLSAVPLNLINAVLLGYIAQVAAWCAAPSWSVAEIKVGGVADLAAIYATLALACAGLLRWLTPERLGWGRPPDVATRSRRIAMASVALVGIVAICIGPNIFGNGRRALAAPPEGGARIEVLDVGQGDAILIRPDGESPILVDGGPPGGDLTGALDSAGVGELSAIVLTHADLDHAGGLADIFGRIEVDHFLFDGVPGALLRQARDAGVETMRVAEGRSIATGNVLMDVLWPPVRTAASVSAAVDDPNARSIVLELKVNGFGMLLTGDAESEAAPFDAGPVDVLKVAHHGSDDAGLATQLAATGPELAIVSAGEDNPFGHPTPATLTALSSAGVATTRTDEQGTISIVINRSGYEIETGR